MHLPFNKCTLKTFVYNLEKKQLLSENIFQDSKTPSPTVSVPSKAHGISFDSGYKCSRVNWKSHRRNQKKRNKQTRWKWIQKKGDFLFFFFWKTRTHTKGVDALQACPRLSVGSSCSFPYLLGTVWCFTHHGHWGFTHHGKSIFGRAWRKLERPCGVMYVSSWCKTPPLGTPSQHWGGGSA